MQPARRSVASLVAIVTTVQFRLRAADDSYSPVRLRHALVLVLTVTSGATDVIGFLALGQAFTSVMTGNLVLFGISIAKGDGTLARHIATAIVCYIAGCAIGSRLAGTPMPNQPVWPRSVTRALLVEFLVFLGFAVVWWVTGAAPAGSVQLGLLAVNALALGIQSSSVQRFGVSGLSTTYLTGTLTTIVARLTSRGRPRDVRDSVQILCSLIIGAAISALLVDHVPMFAPLLQILPVAFVLLGSLVVMRAEPEPAPPPARLPAES